MALPIILRAALPSVPLVNQLPGVRKAGGEFTGLSREGRSVTVTRSDVAAYAAVCGFPDKDTVPLPYPHLLGFEQTMDMMTEPGFPAPAVGMVHVANTITSHRPVGIGETVTVSTRVGPTRPHPKGTIYDFTIQITADGETVWVETSAYLRRGKGDTSASSGPSFPDAEPHGIQWRLPADLGRRYAAVSGDRNPIHLYPITAKALGFPRQIAHGMWTMARCVAALENRLPDAVRVEVAFRKPVLLPGAVAFGSTPVEGGYAFSLTSPSSGSPHLAGRTTAL